MGSSVKIVTALLVAQGLIVVPFLAAADGEKQLSAKQNCNRITRQIAHFEGKVLKMAEERGDEMWQASTQKHVDLLKARRANQCPKYAEEEALLARAKAQAERVQKLMVSAAKGAAKYFSGGWF